MTTKTETQRPKAGEFRGRVGGVQYDDPGLFEVAAQALGFHGYGKREPKWKVGTEVGVTLTDGTYVRGQVWSKADVDNYVWVALENGTFAAVYVCDGRAFDHVPGHLGEPLGRVA